MGRKSELVDLEVILVHQTERAILVKSDKNDEDPVWLPLSSVEINSRNGRVIEITLPEELAIEKELV